MSPSRLISLLRHGRTLALAAATLGAATVWAQVGMTELRAGALPVTVVYPTAAIAATQSLGPFSLPVALGAPPLGGNGRLVVLSHGTGGDTLSLHTLAATLARAGFIVAQPLHQGDNWRDAQDAGPVSFERRPREVSATIDALSHDPQFGPLLRTDRVGVFGMSAGGVTGLSLAGGEWSQASLVRHCAVHVADDGFCLFGVRSAQEAAERQRAFARPVTADAERIMGGASVHDGRVAAVALAVPVGAIFSAESLARIRIPTGLVEAQMDDVLTPAFHSAHVLRHCGACLRLDSMPLAGHFDTLSPWPEPIAQAMARVRGGQRHAEVSDARRQQAYDAITRFMHGQLLP